MHYADAIHWWYDRVNFERRPAGEGDLKLDRMRAMMARLGDPQDQLQIVHIAGSKGKGSTSAMFEAAARASGLRTGLFTSPHLSDVRERIQINGLPIAPVDLAMRLTEVRAAIESMNDAPTFFELATAVAFHHFALMGVQLALMEVGLGGRFDSTNVCQPLLSVITSISYDHMAILGDKLARIAFEKCGIIKPGIPVVSGVIDAEPAVVVRQTCQQRNAPLMELGKHFCYTYAPGRVNLNGSMSASTMEFHFLQDYPAFTSTIFDLNLLGSHQAANASLVAASRPFLSAADIDVRDEAMHAGLANVYWPARMEVFAGSPLTVLDCAHNVASAVSVVTTLKESFPPGRRTLVFACSSDKDVVGILRTLLPAVDAVVFCRYGDNPRAVAIDQLMMWAHEIRPDMQVLANENALAAYKLAQATSPQIVVITGSVFLAGELRPVILQSR